MAGQRADTVQYRHTNTVNAESFENTVMLLAHLFLCHLKGVTFISYELPQVQQRFTQDCTVHLCDHVSQSFIEFFQANSQ